MNKPDIKELLEQARKARKIGMFVPTHGNEMIALLEYVEELEKTLEEHRKYFLAGRKDND